MDALDSVAQVMQVLRRRMSANLQRLQSEGRLPAGASPAAARQEATSAADRSQRAMQKRLQAMDPADARYAERATAAFVESVLLAEFGDGLTNDAGFRQLMLEVGGELRSDPDLARQLGELFARIRG